MNSRKVKFAILLLLAGLLSACASPAAESPASPPTEALAPTAAVPTATQAPTEPPTATDTSAPAPVESSPTAEANVSGATVSFANDIAPILESRCINCHGGQRTEAELSLRTHADLMVGSEGGQVVIPGDADNSALAEMVVSQEMPKRGPKLTPPQVQLIIDWINQGALNN